MTKKRQIKGLSSLLDVQASRIYGLEQSQKVLMDALNELERKFAALRNRLEPMTDEGPIQRLTRRVS